MLLNTLRMSAFIAAALMMTGFSTDASAGSLTGNATAAVGANSTVGADVGVGVGVGTSVQTGQTGNDYSAFSRTTTESSASAESRFRNSDDDREDRTTRLESGFESSTSASGAMTTGGSFNE